MHAFLAALLYFLSGFMPRNRRKAVFGAWLGKRFSDNPKYLLLYLARTESDLDLVWIAEECVRSSLPPGLPVRFIRKDSWSATWTLLTAGTCYVTHGFNDVGSFNLLRGACRVYLGHGLAIKHMGSRDKKLRSPLLTALRRTLRHRYAYDYYVASSPVHREKLLVENATNNSTPDQILECGQPRIDFLLQNAAPDRVAALRSRLVPTLGIPRADKIVTYLPTFRDKGQAAFSFGALTGAQRSLLDDILTRCDAVLVEKPHFQDFHRGSAPDRAALGRICSPAGAATMDTQELLLISDVLITDYSGCFVDFLVLRRPILHFAYDRAYYENSDRGLYFNLDEVAGGPVVESFAELCAGLEAALMPAPDQPDLQAPVRTRLVQAETGTACSRIAATTLGRR